MTRAALVLMILFPAVMSAQEKDPQPTKDQAAANSRLQPGDAPAKEDVSPAVAENTANPVMNWNVSAQTAQRSKPSKSVKDIKRPTIEGSMVGYVDNAIIGSQIRIRFDAAFNDQFPDRAEFFYAKCGCYRVLGTTPPPLSSAVDPNAPGPGPGVPTTLNYQQLYLQAEYAPISRFSVFTMVPVRWLQPQGFKAFTPFPNESGLSDVQAGFKFAALASSSHYLTFQLRAYFPSGDSRKGLGTNHYSIEPSLLYYQRLSSRWAVEGQLTYWHPIGGSAGVPVGNSEGYAGDIVNYGIGPSYRLINRESFRLSPVVELVGWKVLGGFETNPGPTTIDMGASEVGNINIVNLKIGARAAFGRHNSIYAGYGRALTSDDWYKDLFRMEYRYSF
jgi:hypothetical protein